MRAVVSKQKIAIIRNNCDYAIDNKHPGYDNCVDGMEFILEMDRPINTNLNKPDSNLHVIIPGGYSFHVGWWNKNNILKFDFLTTYGYVVEDNPKLIRFEVVGLDTDYSCPTSNLDIKDVKYWVFDEFFVYTGEKIDPEIHPVAVKRLKLICRDGHTYSSQCLTTSANDALTSDQSISSQDKKIEGDSVYSTKYEGGRLWPEAKI